MIKVGKMNESITSVVLDEDKLEKAMKKHNYDADSYFEFLYDIYGLEDGEDFQVGNTGTDLMIRSSVPKKKIDKLKKELCESTMNEGADLSNDDVSELIFLLKKLKTQASEALLKVENSTDYRGCYNILTFLSKDSKRTADWLKKLL